MSPSDISTCRLLFQSSQVDMSLGDISYLSIDIPPSGDISTCRLLFHRSQDNVS